MSDEAPNAVFKHREASETAATQHNPLFPATGRLVYDVTVQSGAGFTVEQVEAGSGDEAAVQALSGYIGGKVVTVNPAAQQPRARKAA